MQLLVKPPVLQLPDQKLSFTPFGHLKKYKLNEVAPSSSADAQAGSKRSVSTSARYVGISNIAVDATSPVHDLNSQLFSRDGADMAKKRALDEDNGMSESFVKLSNEDTGGEASGEVIDNSGFISANTGPKYSGRKGKRSRR